ncbi:MAG: TerC family protein [Maricaulaceae bacterium]|jgi:predicted tellurium resistance membrane protein TerC
MAEVFASPELWLSLATLTFLEIILGIDNVVFVSVAAGRLPADRQKSARGLGIYTGAVMRILMLFALVWLTGLTHATLFHAPEFLSGLADPSHPERFLEVTLEDLILLVGGLFLLWKGTTEIHHEIEGDYAAAAGKTTSAFGAVILQMTVINVVFSLDSVLTAVGMTSNLGGEGGETARLTVMVIAVVLSTLIMVASAKAVSEFLERNPTTKMLALAFILLVGVALIADGLGFHIPRGYLYFAIAFSLSVEALNVVQRNRRRAEAKGGGA